MSSDPGLDTTKEPWILNNNTQEGSESEEETQSTWVLPPEVMIEVFSHLSPVDLDNASLVCRQWYNVLTNEASWRESFSRIFTITRFNRVTSSLKWRTELISRLDYIRKWRKGSAKNLSFNCHFLPITKVFSDFNAARIVVFSAQRGMGLIADPTKGKIAKPHIYTTKSLESTQDVSAVDGSRFGMCYGLVTGTVRILLFSQETRIRDYLVMTDAHVGACVTAAWMIKSESPRGSTKTHAITGDNVGRVFLWDVTKGMATKYEVSETAVTWIDCDSRNRVVIGCFDGSVYMLEDDEFVKVGCVGGEIKILRVDYDSNFLVAGSEDSLYRFELVADSPRVEFESMFHGVKAKFTAFDMDRTEFKQTTSNKDAPGQYGRYLAAATEADHVFVWLLQADGESGRIRPVRARFSPFQVENPELPGITAITLNSAVLLVGSYNGVTIAYDLLTGEYLRVVSSRFSKRALNFRNLARQDGLYPITHLEIDQNPSNPHGVIVVGSAVQYFDFGATFDETSERKRGIQKKRRMPYYAGTAYTPTAMTKEELERDIENDIQMMHQEDKESDQRAYDWHRMNEMYNGEEIGDEEDQLQYAMMLSQQQSEQQNHNQESVSGSDDEVERAIQLSLNESSPSTRDSEYEHDDRDHDDDELKRALEMSVGNEPSSGSSSHAPEQEIDEDLALALKLSKLDN